jgi:hypothetical protein
LLIKAELRPDIGSIIVDESAIAACPVAGALKQIIIGGRS